MTGMRFGVNHTPSGSWFHGWQHLDLRSFGRDFETLASLGIDHVRLLPLWPVLQPNRSEISKAALEDVRRVVELAAECGLDASVDVLQGHLSSFDFVPAWLTTWHKRNMFTDPLAIQAQADLVAALDDVLFGVPGFLGLTLGNEVNQFTSSSHPQPMPATPEEVTAWLAALHGAPGRRSDTFRVNAEYDAVWFDDRHAFLPTHSARAGDLTVVHSWVFNGTAQTYGAISSIGTRLAQYLIELSRAFAHDRERPVWLQEVGAPLNHMAADDAPDFLEATIRCAADSDALWGVTWWCSHDVPGRLADFPDLEYSLGLIDESGSVKPTGRRFAEVVAELRERPRPVAGTIAVVVPVDDADVPLERSELGPGGGVFETWMRLAVAGERPVVVTSRQAESPKALARVGITDVVAAARTGRRGYSAVSDSDMFTPDHG